VKTIWVTSLGSSRNLVKHLMSQEILPCMGDTPLIKIEVQLDLGED
jgi:hypothetical protein